MAADRISFDSVNEVQYQRIVQIRVWGKHLNFAPNSQLRAIERIESQLAFRADHAKLIARHARVPAHIDNIARWMGPGCQQ